MPPNIVTISSEGIVSGAGVMPLVGIPSTFEIDGSTASVTGVPTVIPLNPVPSQILNVTLAEQACTIRVYAKSITVPVSPPDSIPTDPPTYEPAQPVFVDLYVNDALIIGGVIARNRNLIVINTYLGFVGDLAFIDLNPPPDNREGDDPEYAGLGSRWVLVYLETLA